MCKKNFLALVVGYFTIHQVQSQCLGGCSSAANASGISQQLNIPERGAWMIGASLLTLQYQPLSDEELFIFATAGAPVYSVQSQRSFKGMVSYGISKRMSVSAMLPYNSSTENKEGHYHEEEGHAEIHSYGSIDGLGDAIISGTYQFIDQREKGWKAFAGAGIKIPTGKTDAYSTYAVVLPIHLQPGTGSWDPLVNVSVQKSYGRVVLLSDARIKFATTAKEHNMGTYANAGLSVSYELLTEGKSKIFPSLRCSGGISSDYNAPMKIVADGEHDHEADSTLMQNNMITAPNTGFKRLFANASVTAFVTKRLMIPITFSLPVAQHLNGHQAKDQLNTTIGISFIL